MAVIDPKFTNNRHKMAVINKLCTRLKDNVQTRNGLTEHIKIVILKTLIQE